MVQAASASKNLWVAASDGDLDRVRVSKAYILPFANQTNNGLQHLIETEHLSPNERDHNSYTPMYILALTNLYMVAQLT